MPIKLPQGVTLTKEVVDPTEFPAFPPAPPKRKSQLLRRRPSIESNLAFGDMHRISVQGPLGTVQVGV